MQDIVEIYRSAEKVSEPKLRIVVVGHGMVGHRFCERLVALDTKQKFDVTVLGGERSPAYDRVRLSEFFGGKGASELALTTEGWYAENGIKLILGTTVQSIDREHKTVFTEDSHKYSYDVLVLATGSRPFVVPIPGVELPGVFVYRTLDDLIAIQEWAAQAKTAAVIGGGLLGLEAAKAALDLGLQAHVIEYADRLMPRQLDDAGSALLRTSVEAMGVKVHLGARTEAIEGEGAVSNLRFKNGSALDVDLVIISAGIRPRDELARMADISVHQRGGIEVDDDLSTSDSSVFAIGECAVHRGTLYGLVAPGYDMADVLARRLCGEDCSFDGADQSAKLKLLGVEVASFGDFFCDLDKPDAFQSLVYEDQTKGVYQKLIFNRDSTELMGGILVGDAAPYIALQAIAKSKAAVPEQPRELLFGASSGTELELPPSAQICSCNNVTKGDLVKAITDDGFVSLAALKAETKAGTGCGGCTPDVKRILDVELSRMGVEVNNNLCEHFAYSRQELYWLVKVNGIKTFDELLAAHGKGDGCEICRPAVASILATTWNELVVNHASIQDTNDRFLANIQRGGTYSVVPRVPGGEITADKLIVLGQVAKKYDLYCKITGGQRIDLFGARVDQLPEIWEELVAAGFESGHAYGKAMRTVKSCVGSSWCRFGVQDSTAMAIRVEERYRGLRAPHKLKSAVSGCIRECAEAQNKDFGIIATEQGWNLYLGGNGGSSPRHGDLFATDVSDEELIKIIDRYLMFYIRTAKPLQRTARWLEEFEGGIKKLKDVILNDSLGLCEQLEADMQALVDTYACEWKAVVESPELRSRFRHFADGKSSEGTVQFVRLRGQKQPAEWAPTEPPQNKELKPADNWSWQKLARTQDVVRDCGATVEHEGVQLAIFNFERRDEWYATQAVCPHRKDAILGRGLLGDQAGEPKVICPLHKKAFSLETGKCLNDPNYRVQVFPVEVRGDEVWVKLPPSAELRKELTPCAAAVV